MPGWRKSKGGQIAKSIRGAAIAAAALSCSRASADIYQWEWIDPNNHALGKQQSTTLTPGGAGLSLGPAPLFPPLGPSPYNWGGRNLTQAYLIGVDLSNIQAAFANLTDADFSDSTLSGITLGGSTLTGANFTDAYLNGSPFALGLTSLGDTTSTGFTPQQLYSTASYKAFNLSGITFATDDLSGWDFSGQTLLRSSFIAATLANTSFSGATISIDLTDPFALFLSGTNFASTTQYGFTAQQLYDTASYQAHSLVLVNLSDNDLSGWNFAGQNLSYSDLSNSTLNGASFGGAVITGLGLNNTTSRGFTKEQLYATPNYTAHNLAGVGLGGNDLGGWDFTNQNLSNAGLSGSDLTGAQFDGADVTLADFGYAVGFTPSQLYSTASYQKHYLPQVRLGGLNLSGADLSGQFMPSVLFTTTNLSNVNFSGALLQSSDFDSATVSGANFTAADLRGASNLDLAGLNTHNAILPDATIDGLDMADGDKLDVHIDFHGGAQTVTILGAAHFHAGSVLSMIFHNNNEDPWATMLAFDPGIPVSLGGTLRLGFDFDADPGALVGDSWQIFDWTGVAPTGVFDQIVAEPGFVWDTSQLYTTGFVTLEAVPEPAASFLIFSIPGALALRRRKN